MGIGFSRYKKEIQKQQGFTIVELIIVIVVIGILVAIAIVGYGSWKQTTQSNQIKSDLGQAATAMEAARNTGTGYPSSIPGTFTPSSGVIITVFGDSTATAFCIDGSIAGNSNTFYIDSAVSTKQVNQGTCATRSLAPAAPTGLASVSTTDTVANFSWTVASGATSYNGQCATNAAYTTGVVSGVVGASGSSTSGSLTGLSPATAYYCRINAVNATGSSDYTSSVTPSTVVAAVTGFSGSVSSSTYLNGSWSAVPSATSYQVVWATDAAFTQNVATLSTATTSFGPYSPGAKATYYIHVHAQGPTGYGPFSNTITETTTLLAP